MAVSLAAALLLAATAAAAAQEAAPGRALRGAGAAAGEGGLLGDRGAGPPTPPAGAVTPLFSALDQDGDGVLTLREVQAVAGAAQELAAELFDVADTDGSGAVGPEEFGSMVGVLRRRQARVHARLSIEEALRLRATGLRASPEEAVDQGALDEVLDGKDPWTPGAKCEMYTYRPCGEPYKDGAATGGVPKECTDGVSTCNVDGDCVCPDGYCSSTRIGYCTRCDDWDADNGSSGNSSCVHAGPDLVPYPHKQGPAYWSCPTCP